MVLRKSIWLLFMLMYSCSTEQDQEPLVGTPMEKGEQLYQMNCVRCHGTNGSKGASGAKNLKSSIMSKEQIYAIIQNGKGAMPSYKNTIKSDSSMIWLVEYVQTLKK